MEVEDELMDELSMSILEPVPAAMVPPADTVDAVTSEAAEVGNVTITINSRGEINVDQTALAEVIGSGQQSARVTFVRVDDGGLSTIENQVDLDASELMQAVGVGQSDGATVTDVVDPVNLGMLLDPQDWNKIEKVLETDEAKNLLGDAACSMTVEDKVHEETPEPVVPPGPMRRSQRQVDRETRQTAEKIRAQNQENMKKEDTKVKKNVPASATKSPPNRGRGGGSRPSRQRKVPKHLSDADIVTDAKEDDNEGEDEDEDEEEDKNEEDSDSGSWASEDDPDRLWCICQQPHSNKFMICCDSCLDWFHGKCMGITKAQNKEMEEAGKEWLCPSCSEGKSKTDVPSKDSVEDLLGAMETDEKPTEDSIEEESSVQVKDNKSKPSPKSKSRRKSSSGGGEAPKEKTATCHMCSNVPRDGSIYCCDKCVSDHAAAALAMLTKDGKNYKANNPVVVLEPKTNTLLTGPKAPTEATLDVWLQAHSQYHVVMPGITGKKMLNRSTSSTSSTPNKDRSGPKMIAPHRETPEKKKQKIEDLIKKRPIKSKEEMIAEAKAALRRSVSSYDGYKPSKRERRSSDSVDRKPAPIRRKIEKPVQEYVEVKETKSSDKALRSMVVKGTRDALLEKVKKSDLKMEESKILKISEEIEIAMFGTFGDTGSKYKNKYRSLTYNIKDTKNDGLFRRILLKDLSPIEVVQMSADEYASKELQQWRRAEAAKDIEAIKTHELDMIALGNTFVMKSHKGEQVIEKDDPVSSSTTSDALLPENEALVKDTRDEVPVDVKLARDVAKHARESESSPRKKHKKSDKDRHRERHSSSSKSHSHSSSSKDKKHSKDKDRDKDRSSHRSSSDKKQSSSSKSGSSSSKSQSSSSKDKDKEKSSSSSKSSKDRERHRSSSSKQKEISKSPSKSESNVNSTTNSTSELDELQARINKATAAIEAAKKSVANVESINYHENDQSVEEVFQEPEEDNAPGSPIDLDLPEVVEIEPQTHRSFTEGEVSSTVTIPTPDQGESWSQGEEEPSVWEGQVIMQDVAKFSVSAFQVSGTSDYLSVDLKSSLELVGRIPPAVCWDYIDKIGKNPTKEILVLKLWPSNNDEKDNYQSFFQYLSTRDRFGVVGNCNKNVKDCYIMPLRSSKPVPAALLPLSGQGLPPSRPDLLLSIIVRTKRSRAQEMSVSKPPTQFKPQPFAETKARTISAPISFPTLPPMNPIPQDDDAPYSPGSSPEPMMTPASHSQQPKSLDGNLAEKIARLQAEIDSKKAVLEQGQGPGFPNLPSGFSGDVLHTRPPPTMIQHPPAPPNIVTPASQPPFQFPPVGGQAPVAGGSSLSRMSDADLVAAAAAMERPALPPPGPGMPGNLIGQGMANVELSKEEEYGGHWDRRGGGRGGFRGRGGGRDWGESNWRGGRGGNRRDYDGDWNRNRDWRDRDDRDRDYRIRDRDRRDYDRRRDYRDHDGEDYRRGRRDYDRRDRDRERDRSSRSYHNNEGERRGRSEEGSRHKDDTSPAALGTEDWSDDEILDAPDIHKNVAEELANFDKQFLPPGSDA